MNSPDDDSPTSTPSTSSPPPEEINHPHSTVSGQSATSQLMNLASQVSATLTSGLGGSSSSGKRRLVERSNSGFGAQGTAQQTSTTTTATTTNRDPKARRRGESGRMNSSGGWETKEPIGAKKDELIDTQLVDQLRKELGDPFLESGLKNMS